MVLAFSLTMYELHTEFSPLTTVKRFLVDPCKDPLSSSEKIPYLTQLVRIRESSPPCVSLLEI